MNPLNMVSIYNYLFNNREKGSCEKATMEGEVYQEKEKTMIQGGKHGLKDHVVTWNPRPELDFPHAVNDGSEGALHAMVEQIWAKYDLDGDGRLVMNEAKAYVKKFVQEEFEMDDVGDDFVDETYAEIDETNVGFITKETMLAHL